MNQHQNLIQIKHYSKSATTQHLTNGMVLHDNTFWTQPSFFKNSVSQIGICEGISEGHHHMNTIFIPKTEAVSHINTFNNRVLVNSDFIIPLDFWSLSKYVRGIVHEESMSPFKIKALFRVSAPTAKHHVIYDVWTVFGFLKQNPIFKELYYLSMRWKRQQM